MAATLDSMVLGYFTKGLAHLADGSVCWWDSKSKAARPAIKATAVVSVKACSLTGLHAVLTLDGHILAGFGMESPLIDITLSLPDGLNNEQLEDAEIYVSSNVITVKILNSISFLYVLKADSCDKSLVVRDSTIDVLPCIINLSSFATGHGLIRTSDNSTYLIDASRYTGCSCKPVDIADAENIQEIVCAPGFTMLIMKNGTVRACGLFSNDWRGKASSFISNDYKSNDWFPSESNPFVQIEFTDDVSVAKIVTSGLQVFYITTAGQCYYSIADSRNKGSPVLVKGFADYCVENIFIIGGAVIAQGDNGKLCSMWLIHYGPDWSIRLAIDDLYGSRCARALPVLDNKDIISIDRVGRKLCLTNSEGHVYACEPWDLVYNSLIEEIAFFADNPVMVEHASARIGSTASILSNAQVQ